MSEPVLITLAPPALRVAFVSLTKVEPPTEPVMLPLVVTVALFVSVFVPDTAMILKLKLFPRKVCEFVPNVHVPTVPALNVPLFVIPPRNEFPSPIGLAQLPPGLIVTKPTKVFVPVVDKVSVNLPLIEVVPFTVIVRPVMARTPDEMVNPPLIVEFPPKVATCVVLVIVKL